MAMDIYSFQATIPANSSATVDIAMPPGVVEQIDIKVPPGPSGLMGFQLWVKGGQVIPRQQGAYIVTDDRQLSWRLTDLPDTGAWQVVGYNLDIYDHTIELELSVTPIGAVTPATAAAAESAATAVNLQIAGG